MADLFQEYDDIIKQDQANTSAKLKTTMLDAVDTNPDQYKNVLDLSKKTGLHPSLVQGHETEISSKVKQKEIDYDKLIKESPKLSTFLNDPNNAKLVHDDIENLSWFETIGRGIANRGASVTAGLTRFVGKTSAELANEMEQMLPLGTLVIDGNGIGWRRSKKQDLEGQGFVGGATQFFEGLSEDINYQPGTSWEDVKQSPLSQFIPFAIEQGLVSIPDMAAVMINLPAYVTARTGELGQDRAVNDKRKEATVEDFVVAAPFAIGSAFLERLGTKGILGLDDVAVQSLKEVPKAAGKALVKEGLTEAGQESLEYTAETVGTETGFDIAQMGERALAGAVGGAPFGGAVRIATGTGEVFMNRLNQDSQAVEDYNKLKELSEKAKESKLFQRDKEKLAEFLNNATDDQDVFISADAARELFQTMQVNPSDIYNELGVIDQLSEATVTRGDLVTKVGNLMKLADQPYFDELIKDARFTQGDVSSREAEANQQAYEEYITMLAAEVEQKSNQRDALTQSADRVFEAVKADLEATGKYQPDVVDRYATLHRAFAVAMSERANMQPHEVYARYGLNIRDDSLKPEQTELAKKLRTGKKVADRNIYGPSLIQFLADKGGLIDDGGELTARDADKYHINKPGQKKLVTESGMTLDDALRLAIKSGYVNAEHGTATQDDLLNAIDRELSGEVVFSEANLNRELFDQQEEIQRMRDMLEQSGIDVAAASDRDIIEGLYGKKTQVGELDNQQDLPAMLRDQANDPAEGPDDFDPEIFKFQAFQDAAAYDNSGEVITKSEAFKKWFGDSKVVDENGEPLVVYHGTTHTDITEFLPEGGGEESQRALEFYRKAVKENKKIGYMNFRSGTFFSPKSDYAGNYTNENTGVIYPVYIRAENPVYFDQKTKEVTGVDPDKTMDALIMHIDGDINEIAVIDPKQIKSAIGNIGAFDPNDPRILYQSAYHGTPYTFDKFSLDAIGTGEGAQAYGWGLYFAGKREIAEFYRNTLANDVFRVADGGQFNPDSLEHLNVRVIARKGDLDAAIEKAAELANSESPVAEKAGNDLAVLQDIKNRGGLEKETGNLYQADIPDDSELLDWDKPLSEQPDNVKEKLKPIIDQVRKSFPEYADNPDITGQGLYEMYRQHRGGTSEFASKGFNDAGIPGLRYLDASSRSEGEGSRNYVIWDESRVTVEAVNDELRQAQEYEQGTGDKRGSILIPKNFPEGDAVIRLFENANLSTFLHESGHFFLEVYKDLVSQADTPQALKDDFNAILKWMEIENADQIGIDQHEQFARGFEAYLFEGKAPSAELQSVFSRFRAWLVQIYRSLRSLDVKLNDEVREVFDRMLATDMAIEDTENYANHLPMFKDAQSAGMTEAEYAAYNRAYNRAHDAAVRDLEKQNLDEVAREQRDAYRNEKEQVRSEVAERLAQNKAVRAKEFLMRGMFPNEDQLPDGFEAFKLNKQILINRYGADGIVRRLPQGKNKITSDAGIDPDVAAGLLGFRSGDDMLQQIVAAPTFKQAVIEETNKIMKERHGDLMGSKAEMTEAAISATHNDERADFMLTELKALEKRLGNKTTPKEVIRSVAKRIIGEKAASELKEGRYLQASIKNGKEAIAATAKNNYKLAADAKRRQILNHYLFMEAREARLKSEKIQKYMRRVQTKKYDPKVVNPVYITNLKLLAGAYDFRKNDKAGIEKAKQSLINLVRWVNSQANSEDIAIPSILDPNLAHIAAVIQQADDTGADLNTLMKAVEIKSYKDMTINELDHVYNMARHLRFIGGKTSENARVEVFQLVTDLAQSITDNAGKDVVEITDKDWKDKAKDIAKRLTYDQVKLLSDVRQFDGFEDFGPVFRAVYEKIIDGTNTRIKMDIAAAEAMRDIFKPHEKMLKPKNDIRTMTKEDGTKWGLSARERVMLAVYWGSPESREAIMMGHKVTENDVQAMLNTMTEEQLNLVEKIWEHNESYWDDLARIEARVNGVPPIKVEHIPFSVNGREMKGGYMRLYYQWDVRDKFKIDMHDEASKAMHANRVTMSKTGATIARVGSGGRQVKLDIDSIFRAIDDNIQFISFAEGSREVARIVQHPVFANSIVTKYGKERFQSFMDAVDGVFAGNAASNHPINTMLRGVRTNLTFGYLALSIRNMVQQPIALTNVMGKVGELETLNAIKDFYMHPMKWGKFIKDNSPFMDQRNRYINREASEQLASIKGASGLGWKPRWAFILQTMGDAVVTYPAWLAGYRQALKKFTKPGVKQAEVERKARIYADEIVASTVGSGLSKDLPPLFQGTGSLAQAVGPEAVKQLTFMGSFFNMSYNLYFDAWKRADFKSAKSSVNFAREMAWYAAAPGILGALVVGQFPDDDDDESLWEWAVKATAEYGFSASMFWRNLVSAFKGFEPNIPATKVFTGTARISKQVVDIATDEKDLDMEQAAKFIRNFEPIVSLPGGGQAARTLEYLDSYEEGNEGEFSLFDALITGKDR